MNVKSHTQVQVPSDAPDHHIIPHSVTYNIWPLTTRATHLSFLINKPHHDRDVHRHRPEQDWKESKRSPTSMPDIGGQGHPTQNWLRSQLQQMKGGRSLCKMK